MKALASALMVTAALAGMTAAHAEGKTRAQVQQELQDAKAAGQVTFGEQDYPPAAATQAVAPAAAETAPASRAAGKTREQVRAELAQAKARGEYTFGELDYPPQNR